jgi:hypothetical protein
MTFTRCHAAWVLVRISQTWLGLTSLIGRFSSFPSAPCSLRRYARNCPPERVYSSPVPVAPPFDWSARPAVVAVLRVRKPERGAVRQIPCWVDFSIDTRIGLAPTKNVTADFEQSRTLPRWNCTNEGNSLTSCSEFSMLSRQHLIHLAHLGADVRRPLFAARPLHEPTVGAIDFFGIPPAVKVFFGLLVTRLVGRRCKSPRCHVAVSVFTPSGRPAVKICWQQSRNCASSLHFA